MWSIWSRPTTRRSIAGALLPACRSAWRRAMSVTGGARQQERVLWLCGMSQQCLLSSRAALWCTGAQALRRPARLPQVCDRHPGQPGGLSGLPRWGAHAPEAPRAWRLLEPLSRAVQRPPLGHACAPLLPIPVFQSLQFKLMGHSPADPIQTFTSNAMTESF